jgi:hypothetical protein
MLHPSGERVQLLVAHGALAVQRVSPSVGYGYAMYESPEELAALQALLDASLMRASAHLRSIVTGHSMTAAQLSEILAGMCTLSVATTTATCEPRISGADGHFLHGRWHFGTARGAAKARHLAARPAASVAHMRGEELGVFAHGSVQTLNPRGAAPAGNWGELLAYFKDFYGQDAFDWENDVVYYRLNPHWMTAYAPDVESLFD